jgi:hypothetical protein
MERFQFQLGIQETDEPSSDRLIRGGALPMRRLFTSDSAQKHSKTLSQLFRFEPVNKF